MKKALLLCILVMLSLPIGAQDDDQTILSIAEVAAIVADAYPEAVIVEIDLDVDDDDGELLWDVYLADGRELYIDRLTGEIVEIDDDGDAWDDLPELDFFAVLALITENYPDAVILEIDLDDDYWDVVFDDGRDIEIDDDGLRDDDDFDDDEERSFIDVQTAIAIASEIYPNATVIDVDLEDDDDDRLVWDIEFSGDRAVYVSAVTGAVIVFGFDSGDEDDRPGDDSSDDWRGDDSSDDWRGDDSSDDWDDDYDDYDDDDDYDDYDDDDDYDDYDDDDD